jgi:tetratricopeptide (TPR) repeat protein
MPRRLPASAYLSALAVVLAMSFGLPSATFAQERHAQIYLDNLGEPEDGSDELEEHDQLLLPDVMEDDEGAGLPHSAQENKQDRLGLDPGTAPLQPIDRTKFLAELYDRLASARNAQAAQPIIDTIEEVWRISGSATIDLLIARAEQFIAEADLDLALKILDAAADISPEEAEIWHQRALVHVRKQNPERALADLRRTLSIDPKHYRAINELGRMQEELGTKKEALKSYREALKVNPFLDDARRAVDQLSREVEGQDI